MSEPAREALAEVLLKTQWADGGHDCLPTRVTARMLAGDLLASDWLAQVKATARAEGYLAALTDVHVTIPHFLDGLAERGAR